MTKLDLALARIKKLPPDRQEAVAAEIDWILDKEERGESILSGEQRAELRKRLREPETFVSHEEAVAYLEKKHGP